MTDVSSYIYIYDIQTNQWAIAEISDAIGLYGLRWVGTRDLGYSLYVCDFYGGTLYVLDGAPGSTDLAIRDSYQFDLNPYDVVGYRYRGRATIDRVYVTLSTGFYGPDSYIAVGDRVVDPPRPIEFTYTIDHPDNGTVTSFFGIDLERDAANNRDILWVSDYARGALYSVDVNSSTVTLRATAGGKLGLGVAVYRAAASCTPHNGDVDNNRCVDDADLLSVLFAFGQTGANLGRVDVNCDQVVDDADLLIVLFNFGQGCGGGAQYKLYIPDRDAQRGVVVYDPATNSLTGSFGCTTSGTRFYYGIDKHPNGQIWACNHLVNRIDVLDANGNCVNTINSPASFPRGIAVHPNGQVAVVAGGNALHPYNISANSWGSPFASGGLFWGVAWDTQGQFLYATNGSSLFKYRWNGGTSFTQVASGTPSGGGFSADVVVLSDRVLASFGNRIEEFDLNCNRIRTVATAPGTVHGLAQSPDGVIWVTVYENGRLYRLDLSSGTLTEVAAVGNLKVGSGLIAK